MSGSGALRSTSDFVRLLSYYPRPRVIFLRRFARAIGDNLLLSSLLPALRERYPEHSIVLETNWPVLFRHNPHVTFATDKFVDMVRTPRHRIPRYVVVPGTKERLVDQMLAAVGLAGSRGAPELYLSQAERAWAEQRHAEPFLAIGPAAKTTWAANRKQWELARFQQLVYLLRDWSGLPVVQLGLREEPLLEGVVDSRGLELRQSMSVLSRAKLFVGLEGVMMHFCEALKTPAALIYGGFIEKAVSGYPDQLQICHQTSCSPCAHTNRRHTDCDTLECMRAITAEDAFEQIAARFADIAGSSSGPCAQHSSSRHGSR